MKTAWLKLLLLAVAVIGLLLLLRHLRVDVLHLTPTQIKVFVGGFGVWAPAIFLLIYGQPLVPLPITILTMAAGLLFGLWGGIAIALTGTVARACSQFTVARLLGRDAVAGFLQKRVQFLEQHIAAQGFKTVLLVRIIPNVPFDMQNYALGFSSVHFSPYAVGTLLGVTPWTVAFVYVGSVLMDARKAPLAITLTILLLALPLLLMWRRRPAAPSAGSPPASP